MLSTLRILRQPVALATLLVTAVLCAGMVLAVVELTDGLWMPVGMPVPVVSGAR